MSIIQYPLLGTSRAVLPFALTCIGPLARADPCGNAAIAGREGR